MRHGWRTAAIAVTAAWLPLGAAACNACGHAVPEPGASDAASASTPATSSGAAAAWNARHARDDAGRLLPKSTPPPVDSSMLPPRPSREPDWGLDPDDPARDYVRRYVAGTSRYGGGQLDCLDIAASTDAGDRRRVEVRTAARCPGAGTVRDVFLVDVAGDRLSVDDPAKRDPLARWPDGSDPGGPPGPLRDAGDTHAWKGAMKDVIRDEQLVAIRVQALGRGTYPLVTLAGWHGTVKLGAPPETLQPFADKLCRAGGIPMAFLAGIDRSNILRIRCPGGARWERL